MYIHVSTVCICICIHVPRETFSYTGLHTKVLWMCVCMYLHTNICIPFSCLNQHLYINKILIYRPAHLYTQISMHAMHLHLFICTHAKRINVIMDIHACWYVCTREPWVCMSVHVNVYVFVWVLLRSRSCACIREQRWSERRERDMHIHKNDQECRHIHIIHVFARVCCVYI